MYFDDRSDAARHLADALRGYAGTNPLVLAIPRGSVPMGRILAEALGGELDVVLVRKLQAPSSGEIAVGSVDEKGWTFIPEYVRDIGVDDEYLEEEKRVQMQVLARCRRMYTPSRIAIDPRGRTAIVIDDGLATGSTMVAALHAARSARPAKLVCAVPVASREALGRIRGMADEIVCLATPVEIGPVGRFYRDFTQVTDAEVVRILRERQPDLARAAS
jgi:putative phosphoribosyl transferase